LPPAKAASFLFQSPDRVYEYSSHAPHFIAGKFATTRAIDREQPVSFHEFLTFCPGQHVAGKLQQGSKSAYSFGHTFAFRNC
jgi:hypothetical protein